MEAVVVCGFVAACFAIQTLYLSRPRQDDPGTVRRFPLPAAGARKGVDAVTATAAKADAGTKVKPVLRKSWPQLKAELEGTQTEEQARAERVGKVIHAD